MHMHPFVREVSKQLDLYNQNKGGFRKLSQRLFGPTAYFGQSTYINELKAVYNQIKDKETLTMKDLKWFYEECYSPLGKYSNPQFYSQNTDLSGCIYQSIKKVLEEYFLGSIDQYKKIVEAAQKQASRDLDERGGDAHFYSYDSLYAFELDERLRNTVMIASVVNAPHTSGLLWGKKTEGVKSSSSIVAPRSYMPHQKL